MAICTALSAWGGSLPRIIQVHHSGVVGEPGENVKGGGGGGGGYIMPGD